MAEVWKNVEAVQKKNKSATQDLSRYVGTYKDPWYGKVDITMNDGKLHFKSENIADFEGDMSFYKGNTFVVKWNERTLNADAFLIFSLNKEAEANGFHHGTCFTAYRFQLSTIRIWISRRSLNR